MYITFPETDPYNPPPPPRKHTHTLVFRYIFKIFKSIKIFNFVMLKFYRIKNHIISYRICQQPRYAFPNSTFDKNEWPTFIDKTILPGSFLPPFPNPFLGQLEKVLSPLNLTEFRLWRTSRLEEDSCSFSFFFFSLILFFIISILSAPWSLTF